MSMIPTFAERFLMKHFAQGEIPLDSAIWRRDGAPFMAQKQKEWEAALGFPLFHGGGLCLLVAAAERREVEVSALALDSFHASLFATILTEVDLPARIEDELGAPPVVTVEADAHAHVVVGRERG